MKSHYLDYLPIYFQAALGKSPIISGVDILPTAMFISAGALVAGATTQILNKYRPQNALGWVFILVGFGILSLLKADSSMGQWVGYQIIVAAGFGLLVSLYKQYLLYYQPLQLKPCEM